MDYYFIIFDFGMAAIMFFVGFAFYHSKGKASKFIAGYNSKNEKEKMAFDEIRMCKDYGKRMMIWAIPFLIGFVIDVFKPGVGCIIAWIAFAALLIWHIIDMSKNHSKRYRR
ncbi:DUF3784 domain-containing protein [Christensenella hongkongensis]|uniref:DUF3784 domain-containing protein n=1 Tax=Christensenella hongkongensis TaxID=270498 RepID=A0A0M2NH26_9FIRM|nr:DUF3784 domain-containing protein [Christensenella hongkongensis]KKI51854.1 hypothetical protein CHK_0667 [Christensenella hongkongensis]TCW29029.1 uncharacterized protein DUF3784 [Christensenella hongkongensis]